MHLIDVRTLKLKQFIEGSIPPYAILSHRWFDEEPTFKEVLKERLDPSKKGHKKLVRACETATRYEVNYLWTDTCCIDKRSSAELSEAINSMYAWYENAKVCIAYLADVSSELGLDESFQKSVWFTRSWTLQELLAPYFVEFYDGNWAYMGDKQALARVIEDVTRIPESVLTKDSPLMTCTIAERMSWAADRTATRSEDIAYSLMGIFEVNMALLYGEGRAAFQRLQEEIIRRTTDTTFFLWSATVETGRTLAREPAEFRAVPDLGITHNRYTHVERSPLSITNIGIEVELPMRRWAIHIYAIMIASTEGEGRFASVILLRKQQQRDTFYKIGISALHPSIANDDWQVKRKVVILWNHVEEDGNWLSNYNIKMENTIFGFDVFADDKVQLEYQHPIGDHLPHPKPGAGFRFDPEDFSCLQTYSIQALPPGRGHRMPLGNPMKAEWTKIICGIGSNSRLAIYLSFDFDSRPCALISRCPEEDEGDEETHDNERDQVNSESPFDERARRYREARKARKARREGDVKRKQEDARSLEARNIFKRSHLIIPSEEENGMVKIKGKALGEDTFFFAALSLIQITSIAVPEELAGCHMYATFLPSWSMQNFSGFWKFCLSETRINPPGLADIEIQPPKPVSNYTIWPH